MEEKKDDELCPYCGKRMSKWMAPVEANWGCDPQFVCFNDQCPYYVEGWEWIRTHYQHNASYRHRYNPTTGEKGPLPVWSATALRKGIVE